MADGDSISIDIQSRSLTLEVSEEELRARRAALTGGLGYRPVSRQRPVSAALAVYAAMVTSAATGASRDISLLA